MQEHGRAAAVELSPDRLEARIAEIEAAIVALDGEALAIKLVDSALQLGECVLGLSKRQLRQKAETFGVFCNERRAVIVRGDHCGGGLRSVIREQLRGNAGAIHEIEAGLRRELPLAFGIVARGAQRDDVEMSVDVDPTTRHRILPQSRLGAHPIALVGERTMRSEARG
jgi:hypothetical protein